MEIAELLLEAGADVNIEDDLSGMSPLTWAVREYEQNADFIKRLLEAGANVNARNGIGETALIYAVRSGRVRVIKQLLKAGADVNSRDNEGKTALDYAEGREKAAAILRAAGGKRGEEV